MKEVSLHLIFPFEKKIIAPLQKVMNSSCQEVIPTKRHQGISLKSRLEPCGYVGGVLAREEGR